MHKHTNRYRTPQEFEDMKTQVNWDFEAAVMIPNGGTGLIPCIRIGDKHHGFLVSVLAKEGITLLSSRKAVIDLWSSCHVKVCTNFTPSQHGF